jgi:predicted RNA-binding Zn-ribbon protein involved in translation (DUF1610 family)
MSETDNETKPEQPEKTAIRSLSDPAARTAAAKEIAAQRKTYTKICAHCGIEYTSRSKRSRFHNNACRQADKNAKAEYSPSIKLYLNRQAQRLLHLLYREGQASGIYHPTIEKFWRDMEVSRNNRAKFAHTRTNVIEKAIQGATAKGHSITWEMEERDGLLIALKFTFELLIDPETNKPLGIID